jgi:hypothetical protein
MSEADNGYSCSGELQEDIVYYSQGVLVRQGEMAGVPVMLEQMHTGHVLYQSFIKSEVA